MGTLMHASMRDVGELERLWLSRPNHPILEGLDGEFFEIPTAENVRGVLRYSSAR